MICHLAELKGIELPKADATVLFIDDWDISGYARDAVYALHAAEIVGGKTGNRFDPKASTLRSEMARLFYGFLDQLGMISAEYKMED